jgi:hypothetical protein
MKESCFHGRNPVDDLARDRDLLESCASTNWDIDMI